MEIVTREYYFFFNICENNCNVNKINKYIELFSSDVLYLIIICLPLK